jgi:hypothetical protein
MLAKNVKPGEFFVFSGEDHLYLKIEKNQAVYIKTGELLYSDMINDMTTEVEIRRWVLD